MIIIRVMKMNVVLRLQLASDFSSLAHHENRSKIYAPHFHSLGSWIRACIMNVLTNLIDCLQARIQDFMLGGGGGGFFFFCFLGVFIL